jgi:Fe-S cluster assembly ATP-binding protein
LLEIKNLSYGKDRKILKNINLKIPKNEIFAIIGPNGAGKSTLSNIIMGLIKDNVDGEIIFENKLINNLEIFERARLGMTMAPQSVAEFEGITVSEYLDLSKKYAINDWFHDKEEVLKLVGLNPKKYLNRFVDNTLSGGERKRIELASILFFGPKFVILDEIDSGIDFTSIEDIGKILHISKDKGATILMITHNERLLDFSTRAALLCNGEIIKTGSPKEIKSFFEKCKICEFEDKIKEVNNRE